MVIFDRTTLLFFLCWHAEVIALVHSDEKKKKEKEKEKDLVYTSSESNLFFMMFRPGSPVFFYFFINFHRICVSTSSIKNSNQGAGGGGRGGGGPALRHHYRARNGPYSPKGEKMAAACPRWYNAALTHTKWMGNPSSPTLSSNCENRRACFRQTSPGMHVWGILVPIRTVFKRSNRPRG